MDETKCAKCGEKLEKSNNILINKISDKKLQNYNHEIEKLESNYSNLNISETQEYDIENESNSDENIKNSTEINSEHFNNSILLKTSGNIYEDIDIEGSQNVIIGNVTYVTGPVHITQITTNLQEQNVTNQLLINHADSNDLNIILRENWMAEPAKFKTQLPELAQYVIIAHTATEEGYTQSQNALLVKIIQNFHMNSRHWDDIAYNFLVGCDGNIYEARGWNIQGAHTYGYNNKSICIAFIGCFMDHLPPDCALIAAKKLIMKGVKLGFIPEDYSLVGHCQCVSFESPGVCLFNEIRTWPKWRELTLEDSKITKYSL